MFPRRPSLGPRVSLTLVVLAACVDVAPEQAVPDVSGDWVAEGSEIVFADGTRAEPSDTVIIHMETLGSFVHGRWRETQPDGTGHFSFVVTGHISVYSEEEPALILEYHGVTGDLCRVWGGLGRQHYQYEAFRLCVGYETERDRLYFVRVR